MVSQCSCLSLLFSISRRTKKIEQSFSYIYSDVATNFVRNKNCDLLITETFLMTWITNQKEKWVTLSQNLLKIKALSIFQSFEPFVLECQNA